jgi:feruloyl-CoA ortho-hydroxylase
MVVGRRVVEVLLKGLNILNIKDIDKNKEHVLMGGKGININYYPKCPELNWQLEWAVTNISTITLLLRYNNNNKKTKKT